MHLLIPYFTIGLRVCMCENTNELISSLDGRTLCPVNVLGLLVFSNKMNGIRETRNIKHRIMV